MSLIRTICSNHQHEIHLLLFLSVFAIMILNKEDRGRSVHGWSSQMRVGSLSRIGLMTENQGTLQKISKCS